MKAVVAAAAAAVLMISAGCASAPPEEDDGDATDEVMVALDQVPANVLAAARAASPGMTVVSAYRETEDGVTYLEVCGKGADGNAVDIVFDPAGEIVCVETLVPLDAAPANLKAAAVAKVPGLALTMAERLVKKGVTTWEFKGTANGKKVEIVVAESGDVLEVED